MAAAQAGSRTRDRAERSDRLIAAAGDDLGLRVRVYRPAIPGRLPGLLYLHGGGMILGAIETEDAIAGALAEQVGCCVVSVDYRLAPEHPYPAAVEDCYAALSWLVDQAAELDIDRDRVALYGGSAGGGLAAACALLARERRGPRIVLQLLPYPMLDDRNTTPSSFEIDDIGVWDRRDNLEAWRCVLGDLAGTAAVSPIAAPARETDLSGLPPTYIDVGEFDLFRDESVDFASRLEGAGVKVELHVVPGAIHASELFAPGSSLARTIIGWRVDALRRAFDVAPGASSP